MTVRTVLTFTVFLLTLALVLIRPRGWSEAWWTFGGGALMLALGLVTLPQALQVMKEGQNVLLFLLALLLLSALLEASGFFEWAAIRAAESAGGDAHRLYRNVFLLGAVTTATLSLDTTAVILTPVVLAFVSRLRLPARPYIFACAFVANTASLLLPISNLTNLLFAGFFHLSFGGFIVRMMAPQIASLMVNYFLFRRLFRAELPIQFDMRSLPEARSVIPNRAYFRGAIFVLTLVLLGYFITPFLRIEPFVVGFAGCLILGLWGVQTRQIKLSILREVAWSIFPFILGLFIVVRGVENLGMTNHAASWLMTNTLRLPLEILLVSGGAAAASNFLNNIPAALLAHSVLANAHAGMPLIYAALLGTNLGPNLTLFGSLATMLVLTGARKRGEDIRGLDFLKVGIVVLPLTLLVGALTLWLTFIAVKPGFW